MVIRVVGERDRSNSEREMFKVLEGVFVEFID